MDEAIRVRPARASEIPTIVRLVEWRLPDIMADDDWPGNVEAKLHGLVQDKALLFATRGSRLAGMTALDLDHQRILACYVDPELASRDTPKQLFRGIEQVALGYGIRQLQGLAQRRVSGFMKSLGYTIVPEEDSSSEHIRVSKNLLDQADQEVLDILRQCDELGIPQDYGIVHRMPLMRNASELRHVGQDIYGRDQRMLPAAAEAWYQMRTAAGNAGVDLQLVSAYRSIAYQITLVRKKLQSGTEMRQILRTSAAPGYSEHHSGRAVDLTTPGSLPLEEDFANSKAYDWLRAHARFFGFRESYPSDNRHRITWEPWHWFYYRA